jgi:protein-S-isoprenylcysteine O-methyltransferase Ste14
MTMSSSLTVSIREYFHPDQEAAPANEGILIHSYMRHPSYFGFFYWALGTQLLLCNPVSAVAFSIFLWRFFNHRIRGEFILSFE